MSDALPTDPMYQIRRWHAAGDYYAELGQKDIGRLLEEVDRLNRKIDTLRGALQEIATHRLHPTDRIAHEALSGAPIDVELYTRTEVQHG